MRRLLPLLLLLLPFVAFATITTIENFNALSTGNLATQNGWSTDSGNNMTVENTTVQEGANAVSYTDNDLTGGAVKKSITAVTFGTTTVYMRTTANNTVAQFRLLSGATYKALIQFRPDGSVLCSANGAADSSSLGTVSLNTWYQMDIFIDQANSRIRCRFNATTYSGFLTIAFTSIDVIRLNAGSDNLGAIFYYDNISFNDGVAATNKFNFWQFSTFI